MRLPSDDSFCLEDVELDGASTRHGPVEANWAVRGGCGGRGKDERSWDLREVRALLLGLHGVDDGERLPRRRGRKEVVYYAPKEKQWSAGQPAFRRYRSLALVQYIRLREGSFPDRILN